MSSDEKALKIEKVYSQYGFGPDASNILNTEKTLDIIIEAVNELLDTHTVKKPDGLYCSYLFGHAGPCEKGKRDCQYDIDEEIYGKDTHTDKEEKEILLGEDKSDGVHVKLFGYRKDGVVYVTREEAGEGCSCTCQRCGKWFPCRKDSPMVEPIEHSCYKKDGKEDCKSCPTKDGIHLYPCKKKKEEPTTPEKKSWCERAFGVGNCPHRGWNRNDIY